MASLAATATAGETLLLVGNSFSHGLRNNLRGLARSAGKDLAVAVRAGSGWTLEMHLASPSTRRRIDALPWTWVVLQEQSDGIDVERYPFARGLDEAIILAGGRTVLSMTWRRRDATPEEWDTLLGVEGGETGYVPIAFELGVPLAPVGQAFREAQAEDPAIALWAEDDKHASERGRYLAALVLYATLYGESPVGLWAPRRLLHDEVLADQLRAEALVLSDPGRWYLDPPPALSLVPPAEERP